MSICTSRKNIFVIPNSVNLAIKYKAYGIIFDLALKSKYLLNQLVILNRSTKIVSFAKVHNEREIILANKLKIDYIFISPVYKTQTHKSTKPINPVRFINLSRLSNCKVLSLGGLNRKNYQRLKNKNLKGFGGITYFMDGTEN